MDRVTTTSGAIYPGNTVSLEIFDHYGSSVKNDVSETQEINLRRVFPCLVWILCVVVVLPSAQGTARAADIIRPSTTITLSGNPSGAVRDEQTGNVYVVSEDSSAVSTIRAGRLTRTTRLPGAASAPSLDLGGDLLFIANERDDQLHILQTRTLKLLATVPVETDPRNPVVNERRNEVYVPNTGSGTVSVIDIPSLEVVATITVGSLPWSVTMSPDGRRAYVSNARDGTISVIRTRDHRVISTIVACDFPLRTAIKASGRRLYVPCRDSGELAIINTRTLRLRAKVALGRHPTPPALSPNGDRAYVSLEGEDAVAVVDLKSESLVARWPAGRRPFTAVLNPSGTALYVPNYTAGSVSVLDTGSGVTAATLVAGTGARQVLGGPEVYVVNAQAGTVSGFTDVAWDD